MTQILIQTCIKFHTIIKDLQYFFMEVEGRLSNKPKHYAKIPLNKRIKLVKMVIEKAFSISKASAKLSIRPSTAKLILKKYREEGAFFEKRSERLARLAFQKEAHDAAEPMLFQPAPQLSQAIYAIPQTMTVVPPSNSGYFGGEVIYSGAEGWNGMQNCYVGGIGDYGLWLYGSPSFYY